MTGTPQAADQHIEEVRVAMALNGGVSLAVWMGGCAVELDCARRAHAGPEPLDEQRPARRVYAGLCAALDRELVIDIMSGSSAGGINGALLAAAMTTARRLDPDVIRTLWLDLGDFRRLLHPLATPRPADLMNGPGFHRDLEAAFATVMHGPGDGAARDRGVPPNPVPTSVPSLDVTTTDLTGVERTFRDRWGLPLSAREYRARFRFREKDDYAEPTVLAGAARASASFPVAFEPFEVADKALMARAGFTTKRWVVDGGLLDNAPIQAALELIPARRAERQVARYLMYVNPDPNTEGTAERTRAPDAEPRLEPKLEAVVGAIVNLPRSAPFVTQLEAIQRAGRRSTANQAAELALLEHPLDELHAMAVALLRAYRRRRRLLSLQELLGAADGQRVFDKLEALGPGEDLPWIPLAAGPPPVGWGWGILGARRVQHLALDVLRPEIRQSDPRRREALLAIRARIDDRVERLMKRRKAFDVDPSIVPPLQAMAEDADVADELAGMRAYVATRLDPELRKEVIATARDLYAVPGQLAVHAELFGDATPQPGGPDPAALDHFLRRVLAIEVVRRAFAADDEVQDSQPLDFVQLTPFAPDLLLSRTPLSDPPRPSPRTKLTGIELGHFAGFYRGSWRANDFLWGRLDAAARIVAMLVSPDRASQLARDGAGDAAAAIAAMLLPADATEVEQWLVAEALDDAGAPGAGELPARLLAALRVDLDPQPPAAAEPGLPPGELTRALCIRAAQLEILIHELPEVIEQAVQDERRGSTQARLDLPSAAALRDGGGVRAAIESLREPAPLPVRLGRDDPAEHTSDLAVGTGAHAALVALAVLRGTRVPLRAAVQGLRGVLLPVAGAVSRPWEYRTALALAYWAAAGFIAVRLVTLPPDTRRHPLGADLNELSLAEALMTLIALMTVAGTAALPFIRARLRGGSVPVQGAWAAAIVAAGGLLVIVLAWRGGGYGAAEMLVADTERGPPTWALCLPILLVFGRWIVRVPKVGKRIEAHFEPSWRGPASAVLVVAAALPILAYSLPPLAEQLGESLSWRWWAALVAVVGAPLVAAAYLLLRPRLARRRLARPETAAGAG